MVPASPTGPPPSDLTLSPALEAFAVQLETRVEGAWKTLLSQVTPTFGDPIAAQIAHLMKTFDADGEYDGELIRKMLSEKDAKRLASTEAKDDLATALPDALPEDDDDDHHTDDLHTDDSDWPSDSEDSEDEDRGSAGGPPLPENFKIYYEDDREKFTVLPGTRLIDGEWKMVPRAEWTDAEDAIGWDLFGPEDKEKYPRSEEEWFAGRARFVRQLDKDKLVELVLMDEMEKDDYITDHMNAQIDRERENRMEADTEDEDDEDEDDEDEDEAIIDAKWTAADKATRTRYRYVER
jgi:hypothetical protein